MDFPYDFTRPPRLEDAVDEAITQFHDEYWQDVLFDDLRTEEQEDAEKLNGRANTASEEEQAENRLRRLKRAVKRVERYVNANRLFMMWTFTFAPEMTEKMKFLKRILPVDDQMNRDTVMKKMNTFLTKLRKKCQSLDIELKYVLVPEKHDSEETDDLKRGTYHIHMVTNLEYFKHDDMQKLWGYGSVWYDDFRKEKKQIDGRVYNVERPDAVGNPGAYVAKYVTKNFDDAESWGKRSFTPSQNLIKPEDCRERNEQTIKEALKHPANSFYEDYKAGNIPKAQYQRICDLRDIDEVKIFEQSYPFEFEKPNGKVVKGTKRVQVFNFKALYPNTRVKLLDTLPY